MEPTLASTKSVLIVSPDAAVRQFLGNTARKYLTCRVLQASGSGEAHYLVAVEGSIRLLLIDSLRNEQVALARWFLTTQPGASVLVVEQSLWKLTGAPGGCEQMLLAKSYTPDELAYTVRTLVLHRTHGARQAVDQLKETA